MKNKTQEDIWEDINNISYNIDSDLTKGMVRNNNCFRDEGAYCKGVDNGMEALIKILKEKYILTEK